tara:strand:- start:2 stop:187 length:186 start_codon:yes stop_codon:yes gene_type:complete
MPLMNPRYAQSLGLVVEIPVNNWNYLYDLMTETFLYIGEPSSPVSVNHDFSLCNYINYQSS